MKTLTIAVIAGDGVGMRVVPQAKRVLDLLQTVMLLCPKRNL